MSLLEKIRNDISGAAILRDWLGDGDPVHQMVADARAKRCLTGNEGKPCPLNIQPNWWDRVKSEIADWIKSELELKNRMELKADGEDGLSMCQACGCCLKLKVWTPIKHIKDHISKEQLGKTPGFCWMRAEIGQTP